jgi:hypothetical protein
MMAEAAEAWCLRLEAAARPDAADDDKEEEAEALALAAPVVAAAAAVAWAGSLGAETAASARNSEAQTSGQRWQAAVLRHFPAPQVACASAVVSRSSAQNGDVQPDLSFCWIDFVTLQGSTLISYDQSVG